VQRVEGSRRAATSEGSRARSKAIESIRAARDEALESVGAAPGAPPPQVLDVSPGDRVRVADLGGVIGEVVAVLDGGDLDLVVSGKRLRAPVRAVSRIVGGKASGQGTAGVIVSRTRGDASPAPAEINVVGLTVDEALPRVDKMLDEAVLAERHEVRVIHGYGQGRLRTAVAGLLSGHPHVAAFRAGGERDGGGGVTVVELKE
jgi:DNA mismatch repair protein MutS2